MLARQRRLSRADFAALPPAASVYRGKTVTVKVFAREGVTKCAVVIPKKEIKRSVDRHLVKRRIMESLTTIPQGYSIILYIRAGAFLLSFHELAEEITTLLRQARVLH